jgi:hypothetical protein
MPIGTCDPASRGEQWNVMEMQVPIGDGVVRIWCQYGWDGVSQRPDCDGPLNALRVSNTGTASAYARLPGKRRGDPWVEIPAGTDTSINAGQRFQLGLENRADLAEVTLAAAPGG